MIKLDIINQTGFAKTKAEKVVETVFEGIKEALNRGERIEFRGFGIFEVRPRKTGIGRNLRKNIEVRLRPGKSNKLGAITGVFKFGQRLPAPNYGIDRGHGPNGRRAHSTGPWPRNYLSRAHSVSSVSSGTILSSAGPRCAES